MGFFSDGENDTKTAMAWKEHIYLFFGENAVFQFIRISVVGASLNCFTIFYLHYIVDKEFIVVVCDVLLITEYK